VETRFLLISAASRLNWETDLSSTYEQLHKRTLSTCIF